MAEKRVSTRTELFKRGSDKDRSTGGGSNSSSSSVGSSNSSSKALTGVGVAGATTTTTTNTNTVSKGTPIKKDAIAPRGSHQQFGAAPTAKRGFWGKLFNRGGGEKENGGKGAASTALPVSKTAAVRKKAGPKLDAHDLEDREAQLERAGFAQLPGTLLSRAKGGELDKKFILKWEQFELQKEIGEGAYALVYLAKAKMADGSFKEVALKELKVIEGGGGFFVVCCLC